MYSKLRSSSSDFIFENKKKLTVTRLTEINNKKVIKKSFSVKSPYLVKKGFEKEKVIYALELHGVPGLVKSDDFSITIEYIDGVTLGELAFCEQISSVQVNNVIRSALTFYQSVPQKSKHINFNNLQIYIGVLAGSGPAQTKDLVIRKPNWLLSKMHRLSLYFLMNLCKVFLIIENSILKVDYLHGISHSDFHYNNIIIKGTECYFIDFERSELEGFFIYDLLFILVLLEKLDGEKYRKKLEFPLKKKLLGSLGKRFVFLVFKWAVLPNKKFKKYF